MKTTTIYIQGVAIDITKEDLEMLVMDLDRELRLFPDDEEEGKNPTPQHGDE